ncbi:MAG: thioesterase family protein [Anaerolineales bacterium]|nr:thioesterase family protein [Anaerolineales bacterium]
MDLSKKLIAGMKREETFHIQDEHAAIHVGSGSLKVLATPWMIAFMERVSHRMLAEHLSEGYSSVGAMVTVRHLAPTPIGSPIRVQAEITEVDFPKVKLVITAWDGKEQVGTGDHLRVVIEEASFHQRIEAKRKYLQQLNL